jgi:hypothetical protein
MSAATTNYLGRALGAYSPNTVTNSAPTAANDNSQGYVIGSTWTDTATGVYYVCVDATVGAAVWVAGSPQAWSPISASGAINPHAAAAYIITKPGIAVLTLAAPTVGVDDDKVITISSSTLYAHTLTATGLLGTGTSAVNEATFAAYRGAGLVLKAFGGYWNVISSVGISFS